MPFVQMFHTLGEMKNSVAKNAIDLEVSARIAGERQVMGWADGLSLPPLSKKSR